MKNDVQDFSMDFSVMLHDIVEKKRLLPLIRAALQGGFPDFSVDVEGFSLRPHDGWWHPSMVGTWTQRKLFLYLARPDLVTPEDFENLSIEAVTVGKFWHVFYQTLLQTCTNVLVEPEIAICDQEHRVRGHADGLLAADDRWGPELLEIKTINEFQFPKLASNDDVKKLKPDYYAQAQDYLAIHFGYGVGAMRFLVVYPGVPFPKNEFVVTASERYQRRRMQVYADAWGQVQEYRAGGHVELAEACCMPTTAMARQCACRVPCPIGRND